MRDSIHVHTIHSKDEPGVNLEDYSKFKYGDKSVARKFGRQLGRRLAQYLMHNVDRNVQIVVASSPYNNIPTATFTMKDYVVGEINREFVQRGMLPVQETKIFRTSNYVEDYSTMDTKSRLHAIGREEFYTDAKFLNDKFVVLLDDVRITGTHERIVEKMIRELELNSHWNDYMFAYYGRLVDENSDATIEDYLNFYSVKTLLDLDKIIKNGEFVFNTRNVKMILSSPYEDCKPFFNYQSDTFLNTLYNLSIANGYHMFEKLSNNFKLLQQMVHEDYGFVGQLQTA